MLYAGEKLLVVYDDGEPTQEVLVDPTDRLLLDKLANATSVIRASDGAVMTGLTQVQADTVVWEEHAEWWADKADEEAANERR